MNSYKLPNESCIKIFTPIDVFPIKDHIKDILKLQGLRTDKDVLSYSKDDLIKGKFFF